MLKAIMRLRLLNISISPWREVEREFSTAQHILSRPVLGNKFIILLDKRDVKKKENELEEVTREQARDEAPFLVTLGTKKGQWTCGVAAANISKKKHRMRR